MISLLGLILPQLMTGLSQFFPALFSFLAKKQDITLSGFQTAAGADVEMAKAQLQAQLAIEQVKAAQNTWIGAKIIAGFAGEMSALYYASIVLDSMFHFGWQIAKLPPPWDQYSWVILSSFIVVSPVAPVLSATTAWLGRR